MGKARGLIGKFDDYPKIRIKYSLTVLINGLSLAGGAISQGGWSVPPQVLPPIGVPPSPSAKAVIVKRFKISKKVAIVFVVCFFIVFISLNS